MSLVKLSNESIKRRIFKYVYKLIKKIFFKEEDFPIRLEKISNLFMATYSEVYTNDVDVELYFKSLHLFHIEEGDETEIMYVEFKKLEYTILKKHLMTSANRQIAYLYAYVDFKIFDYNTFLKFTETGNCCISFTISALTRKTGKELYIRELRFPLKTLEIRDIDFYNMILSVEKMIGDLESEYIITHWSSIRISIT